MAMRSLPFTGVYVIRPVKLNPFVGGNGLQTGDASSKEATGCVYPKSI